MLLRGRVGSLGFRMLWVRRVVRVIEEAAEAIGDGVPWYQLYWPSREKDDTTISMLNRTKAVGFTASFVTLDTYVLGWGQATWTMGKFALLDWWQRKLTKIQVQPDPPIRPKRLEVGFSDPGFRKQFKEKHGVDVEQDQGKATVEWTHTIFSPA